MSFWYVCMCVILWSFSLCVCAGHHTVYIGVHVPKSYRRRRRHRRRSNHKERRERLMENVSDTETTDDPSSSILKPLSKSQTVHQFTAVCLMIWNTICFAISSPKPSKKIALFAKCKSLFADDLSLCWSSSNVPQCLHQSCLKWTLAGESVKKHDWLIFHYNISHHFKEDEA